MDLQGYLNQRGISKYRLAQISGVPNTTIVDICAGRSEIGRCAAKTVQQLAKALDCTMGTSWNYPRPMRAIPDCQQIRVIWSAACLIF